MTKQRRLLIAGGVLAVGILAAGGGIAVAVSNGDDDQPLTGETYDRAVAAALEYTRGGTVTETEVGDDGAAYDVEVRLADGSQVEVQLNANFEPIGSEPDDDAAGEDDDGDGDDD